MATIYRIQDKDGRGPFKPDFSKNWVRDRPDYVNLKPMYNHDIKLEDGLHHGIGCLTAKELKRWFTEKEYEILRTYGYCCKKIQGVKIIKRDKVQVLFSRELPLSKKTVSVRLY